MSDVLGLGNYNKSSVSTNKLFAAYANDIIDVDTSNGYTQGLTTDQKGEFATYLDYCFFVNGTDATRSFNGSSWSTSGVVNRCPIAKYIQVSGVYAYLGYVTINGEVYPSKVWKSGLPYSNAPRWEIEWGTNLVQTASSAVITSANAHFEDYGIKAGDDFWILDGDNTGQYIVYTVDSNTQITLTETLDSNDSSNSYIVGSNYIDVRTDDNDYIRGLGENSNRLLIFKLLSLHKYNGSSLVEVTGAPGTSSHRSIVNVGGYTLYFHGSEPKTTGIYLFNGLESVKISKLIQPYIDGISASMYPSIVGWQEGDWYRCYVGDISNPQRNISVSKAVISYNVSSNKFSIDPINKTIKCSTKFLEDNQLKTFLGDDNGEVFYTPNGYNYDGDPIPWAMETGPIYPEGSEINLRFTRIQVIGRDARSVRVRYKLYNSPLNIDTQWQPLDDLENDKTELRVPSNHRQGCGINIRLEDNSNRENSLSIEKITIFYEIISSRTK